MMGVSEGENSGGSGQLSRPPANFSALVASGESFSSIARTIGVKRDTVAKWAELPEVVAEVEEVHRGALTALKSRVKVLASKALDTLVEVMEDPTQPASRVSAAKEILGRVLPSIQAVELSGTVTSKNESAALSDDELEAEYAALQARRTTPT